MRVKCKPGYGQIYLIAPLPLVSKSDSNGYVGQNESSLYSRVVNHKAASSRCVKLARALKAHGLHNFTIRRLQHWVPKDQLNDAEMYWIAKMDTWHHGYNCGPGGSVGNIMQDSDVRANHKAALARPDVKAKCRAAGKRRWADPAYVAKHKAGIATAYTAEVRAKMSENCKKQRQNAEREVQRGVAKRETTLRKRAERRAALKTDKERRRYDLDVAKVDRYNAKSGRSMTFQREVYGVCS